MITEKKIHQYRIVKDWYVKTIKKASKKAEYGGESSVYSDHQERMEMLPQNQLTGELGEYGGILTIAGVAKYLEKVNRKKSRHKDFGNDVPGAWIPIDIKTSNVKIPGFNDTKELLDRRFIIVSKKEYNPNSIYVACCVPEAPSHEDETFEVWVIGWCYGNQMREYKGVDKVTGETKITFREKYRYLTPMSRVPFEHKSWTDLLDIKKAS